MKDWRKEFYKKFHPKTIWVVPSDENIETIHEIADFIQELLKEQKKEYDNLYFEISMLRQMIGDGLDDVDKIYQKLNELTPLMSDEEKKKMDKHLRDVYPSLYKLKE